jgi:phosphomevalonate kinase
VRRALCISGKRFSGKDTFARLLAEAARARGVELGVWAFAAESKKLFARSHPEVELARLVGDRDYKETWRPQLTRFTVESIAADPLVFVREVARHIERDPRPPVITDLRLRLELDWLQPRFDVTVIRMQRPDALRAASGWRFDAAKDGHHTETELDEPALWTALVSNDGTEAALAQKAEAILEQFLSPRSGR